MKTTKRSHVFLLLALLASCAHTQRYAEPNLPASEVATLECTAPVWIVSLDGQSVSSSAFSDVTRIRISPDAHRVEVSYQGMNTQTAPSPRINGAVYNAGEVSSSVHENNEVTTSSSHNITLNFVAKPGFAYFIKNGIGAKSWNPSIGETPRQ